MNIQKKLKELADTYASNLKGKVDARVEEMKSDNNSYYLIYRVLGVTTEEGELIDVYQNKGRFLYRYAGSFLEAAAKLCFLEKYPDSGSVSIPNTIG